MNNFWISITLFAITAAAVYSASYFKQKIYKANEKAPKLKLNKKETFSAN